MVRLCADSMSIAVTSTLFAGLVLSSVAAGATWSTMDQATLSSIGAVHPSADGKWACYDEMGTRGVCLLTEILAVILQQCAHVTCSRLVLDIGPSSGVTQSFSPSHPSHIHSYIHYAHGHSHKPAAPFTCFSHTSTHMHTCVESLL